MEDGEGGEGDVILFPVGIEDANKYKFNGQEYQDELGLNLYDMDMRDYDPAIGKWLGIDPVTHFDQSTYMAMDGNPVLIADPSGADGLPPEGINTWHYAGNNSLNSFINGGTGNLSNGDHFLGSSNDEFWGGETAYTGGDMAWNNYFANNSTFINRVEVGELQALPSFSTLQSNYLGDEYTSAQVYELIGGKVYQNYLNNPSDYANSCALRMSYALNKSGVAIPYTKGQTGSGKDGKWYFTE